MCFKHTALSNPALPRSHLHPTSMRALVQSRSPSDILMPHLSLTTVRSLRMPLVRRDDLSSPPSRWISRVSRELAVGPTGTDVLLICILKGRAGKTTSATQERVVLCICWRAIGLHAIHSPCSGQQQRGPTWNMVRVQLRSVGMGGVLHAQLVSRGGTAVRASAERRRVLLA